MGAPQLASWPGAVRMKPIASHLIFTHQFPFMLTAMRRTSGRGRAATPYRGKST
jgi:hypothetical protein